MDNCVPWRHYTGGIQKYIEKDQRWPSLPDGCRYMNLIRKAKRFLMLHLSLSRRWEPTTEVLLLDEAVSAAVKRFRIAIPARRLDKPCAAGYGLRPRGGEPGTPPALEGACTPSCGAGREVE